MLKHVCSKECVKGQQEEQDGHNKPTSLYQCTHLTDIYLEKWQTLVHLLPAEAENNKCLY